MSPKREIVVIPNFEDLPRADAELCAEVQLLGHFPRSLNGGALETATAGRRDERNLLQRFQRRRECNIVIL